VVSERSEGNCIPSLQSTDPTAYRCFTNSHKVVDPCWIRTGDSVCLEHPWTKSVIVVRWKDWTAGDPNPTPPNDMPPWALEIQHPNKPKVFLRCASMGGATGEIAGKRINWECGNDEMDVQGYALGLPMPLSKGPWSVYFSEKDSADVVEAPIRTLWK
jgi:hypothetical protein